MSRAAIRLVGIGAALALLPALAACSATTTTTTTTVNESQPHSHGAQALLSPAEAVDLDPEPGTVRVALAATAHALLVAENRVDGLAFNHQVPGPTIRARKGQRLIVDFLNFLDEPTALHLHGLALPFAMDDALATRPVPPGGTFRYQVTLTDSGTFWYHPLLDAARAVDRGLYGVLVVEDPGEPSTTAEVVLVFDAFGETVPISSPDGGVVTPGGDGHTGHSHADVTRTWTVNGQVQPIVPVAGGTSVRARLLNASNSGYLALRIPGLRQIASDQGLLPALRRPDRLILAPGDRAEVELLVGESGFTIATDPWSVNGGEGHGDPTPLLTVQVTTPAPAPDPRPWPFVARAPTADPGYSDVVYVLSGEGDTWLINGEAYPAVTPASVPVGRASVVEVRNVSSTEHPVHLHGGAFEVLSVNGATSTEYTLEDTFNLPIGTSARLRLQPRFTGDWRIQCDSFPHADAGMTTILHVGEGN